MQNRSLFLAVTAGVLVGGFGAMEAQADFVPIPNTLDRFVNANGSSNGNFTTVQQPNELDTFSSFSYSVAPVGTPPAAMAITVSAFLPPNSPESGLTFSGAFFAVAGTTVDYKLNYKVTAPQGFLLNDAVLSATVNSFGGTGSVSIAETLTFPDGSKMSISLGSSNPAFSAGPPGLSFAGVTSITVSEDILLQGGSNGALVSILNNGFSSTGSSVVPEPKSMISFSIGMAVLLVAFCRFSRRRSFASSNA
jgi:hypothetical protein